MLWCFLFVDYTDLGIFHYDFKNRKHLFTVYLRACMCVCACPMNALGHIWRAQDNFGSQQSALSYHVAMWFPALGLRSHQPGFFFFLKWGLGLERWLSG